MTMSAKQWIVSSRAGPGPLPELSTSQEKKTLTLKKDSLSVGKRAQHRLRHRHRHRHRQRRRHRRRRRRRRQRRSQEASFTWK